LTKLLAWYGWDSCALVDFYCSRGLQYGDGLFETVALIDEEPLFWESHLLRLRQGAALLGIQLEDEAEIQKQWESFRRCIPKQAARRLVLKILVQREQGQGYGTPAQSPARLLWLVQEWPKRDPDYWNIGITAGLSTVPLQTGAPYLTVKSLNRLNQIMARRALPATWQEAVLLDLQGFLREGIQSNLLWRQGAVVYTPDLEDGGISGIQRDAICRQLPQWGFTVKFVRTRPAILRDAHEILFCNSLIGAWPVANWQGRVLPGAQGPLAQSLAAWHEQLGLGPQ